MSALKRLRTELKILQKDPPCGITAGPVDPDDMLVWEANIPGPVGSPYHGGTFLLVLRFTKDYPFAPPHVRFVTKIFHPNIGRSGLVCLDLLTSTAWSPALDLGKLLLSLSSLLAEPNALDPLYPQAARLYLEDVDRYNTMAQEWTRRYAVRTKSSSSDDNKDNSRSSSNSGENGDRNNVDPPAIE